MTNSNLAIVPQHDVKAPLKIEVNNFKEFFSQPIERPTYDLAEASLVKVMLEFQNHKRKLRPKYDIGNAIANIKRIEEEFGETIYPMHINEHFYELWIPYMADKGLAPSTMENYCSAVVRSIEWATSYNCPCSPTFKEYKLPKFRKEMVVLTADDVSKIYHFDIEHKFMMNYKGSKKTRKDKISTLKKVRDMFVLSCNLGQRVSDMMRITPDCFNDNKTSFHIIQQKTTNKAIVDLKKMIIDKKVVRDILERYNYHAPFVGSTSNYDDYIHELMAKIFPDENDVIITDYKLLGEIRQIRMPKSKAIASHTARRTYATYHVNRGIPETEIRKATGHSDSKSFCRYIIYDED